VGESGYVGGLRDNTELSVEFNGVWSTLYVVGEYDEHVMISMLIICVSTTRFRMKRLEQTVVLFYSAPFFMGFKYGLTNFSNSHQFPPPPYAQKCA
jgi:hypothetical protein